MAIRCDLDWQVARGLRNEVVALDVNAPSCGMGRLGQRPEVHQQIEDDTLGHLATADLLFQLRKFGRRVPRTVLWPILVLQLPQTPRA